MKLLWLVPQPFYSARGTPMNVRRLAETVAAAGYEIDIVTSGLGDDVSLPPGVRIIRARRLPFLKRIPIGPSFSKLLSDAMILLAVLGILAGGGADLYDYMQGFEEGAWIAALFASLYKIDFVYDMDSDMEEQSSDSGRAFFRRLAPLVGWIDRRVIRRSAGVLTVCQALSEKVLAIAPGKAVFQIEDTPNVDVLPDRGAARSSVRRWWNLPEGPLVVYTGNLEPYQGVDLLVRAAERVLGRSRDAVFLIVGGEKAQVEELRRLITVASEAERIVFTGQRPEAEMSEYLAAADVLVSPRSLGTNTPLKLYAYLQSGTSVVATDRPVHAQVIRNGEALLAPATPEGLAEAILKLLGDPSLRSEIGSRGRALVERKYSQAAFAEKARIFLASLQVGGKIRGRA